MSRRDAAIGAFVVALAAWWLAFGRQSDSAIPWAEVKRGDLVLTADVEGKLEAVHSVPIGPPQLSAVFDFKISMLAPDGADVPAGAPVLGFDTSELQRRLLEKRAESDSAQKRIEKKEKDAEIQRENDELRLAEATSRFQKAALELDVPPDLVKSQQLRETRLEYEDAKREKEFLEAKLEAGKKADDVILAALRERKDAADRRVREITESIDALTLKAPRAGTVVYVTDWRGAKHKVGDSAWRGEHVLEIPDLHAMRAEGEVDESDAGRINVGQKVTLRLEAHPDVEFTGRVESIWGSVQQESWRSALKVVKVMIALDTTDPLRMRPGMRFRGVIDVSRVPNAILAPIDAVFPSDAGPIAYRKSAMSFETAKLTIGARNQTTVEVRSGLAAGDRIARRDLSEPPGGAP